MKAIYNKPRYSPVAFRFIRQGLRACVRHLEFRKLAAKYRGFEAIVIKDRDAGFFSIYLQAICAYRIAQINNQKVLFEFDSGPYYSAPKGGSSWWDYYFERDAGAFYLKGEIPRNHRLIDSMPEQAKLALLGSNFNRNTGFMLSREFPFLKSIRQEIDRFAQLNFSGHFVIGLHYRGTDKVSGHFSESVRVDYMFIERVLNEVLKFNFPFRLFVATDEHAFVDFLSLKKDLDICFTSSMRSTNGNSLHSKLDNRHPYQLGLEALMDASLLSKCDFLLRTDSNLSKASEFFEPKLESLNLSRMFTHFENHNNPRDITKIAHRIAASYSRKSTHS